ncbi:EamA family transporter [Rubrivivax sp. A210]|uniref:DMT family transporter n=1 Tax=Rubrivivax sp. A210 TaxID=2772301 RepID=UPI00191AC1F3|nr:DMT family transporter [Rubrivivax sp. A210]CAD5371617.1 EamA family transporter [Rubrivivax sp. A210]
MPLTALLLVLLAALAHASWNIAAKRAGGDHRFTLLTSLLTVVVWLPAGLWFGVQELPRWGGLEWGVVVASAVVHLLYFNALLTGYRVGDLTVVYPLARGSGPLMTATAAVLLLGETLGAVGLAGVLGVCVGVFLIAGGPALWRGAHDPAQRARTLAGIRWGLITGTLIAGYSVIDGYAIKVLVIGPVIFDYMCNLLRLPLQLPLFWRDRAGFTSAWPRQWRHALAVAVLGPLGYILVLSALQLAPLSHVAPAREVSMLVAAVLGGRLLGEGDRGPRLLGAACIAGGVMALAVG